MKQNSEFNFAFKIMRFAVAGAIPLLACMSNAQATLTLTSDANGNLNVAGSGLSQNALVIGPSNFYSVQTNGSDGVATTIAGYSTGNGNYNLTNILNIANTPTINILNGTQITTGLMDLASGLGGTTTAQDTTATFVGGTNAFTVSGINPERDSADLGASLRLTGGGDVVKQSVSLNYDANVKSQYVTQYVTLNARFDF